jgi:acyl carrier protein
MMDREELEQIVLAAARAQAANPAVEIGMDTPLGPEGLGIDSIGCLDLVLQVERETGISMRDDSLTAEVLATPGSLVEHLLKGRRG